MGRRARTCPTPVTAGVYGLSSGRRLLGATLLVCQHIHVRLCAWACSIAPRQLIAAAQRQHLSYQSMLPCISVDQSGAGHAGAALKVSSLSALCRVQRKEVASAIVAATTFSGLPLDFEVSLPALSASAPHFFTGQLTLWSSNAENAHALLPVPAHWLWLTQPLCRSQRLSASYGVHCW